MLVLENLLPFLSCNKKLLILMFKVENELLAFPSETLPHLFPSSLHTLKSGPQPPSFFALLCRLHYYIQIHHKKCLVVGHSSPTSCMPLAFARNSLRSENIFDKYHSRPTCGCFHQDALCRPIKHIRKRFR